MITAEQIPDDVVEAARRAYYAEKPCGFRESIAAALAAWPNWSISPYAPAKIGHDYLILPLPKEGADE
jgi:hypothetical protein